MGRKITIEPVTRIEGHARVTVHLDDDGNVERAYFHVDQFRGFEKFCEGRLFFEMPAITPRICGICPVSHHLASAKACDMLVGAEPPRPASLLRELMHMGQMIQSHSMHFFHLAGPDLILGFDADPKIRNVVGLIQADPELTLKAVKLRQYGQEIISTLSGRRIHPKFAIPGGVNRALTGAERDQILAPIDEMIASMQVGLTIAKQWLETNQEIVQRFANFRSGYMGLVDPETGALELYDGDVRLIDQDGKLLEQYDGANYLDYISEHVEDWSYLKFPYYKKMGWPGGVYRVAPLGRLNVANSISTPLANEEFKKFKALSDGPVEPSLYMHYARLIEDVYAAERTRELLEDPDILSTDIVNTTQEITGEGVGTIEAPRGTLFHHYKTDENGQLTKVNLIVATGHNNWAMSKSVDMVAKEFIDGKNITEGMLNRVEAAIRAYDPCLSCSTHAVGQMPLLLDVYGSDGELLNRLQRD
ncbi:MAG: Ni/Fe hydrogenase subunit alpha [Anaerolineae bacterium]|nr:Ni/Fe hydrogenase subunit alpha [Anaerolineae bacterium]